MLLRRIQPPEPGRQLGVVHDLRAFGDDGKIEQVRSQHQIGKRLLVASQKRLIAEQAIEHSQAPLCGGNGGSDGGSSGVMRRITGPEPLI